MLEKGAGFTITDKKIPYNEFVTAAQEAGECLPQCQALALKAEVTEILKNAKPGKSSLTVIETRALNTLER